MYEVKRNEFRTSTAKIAHVRGVRVWLPRGLGKKWHSDIAESTKRDRFLKVFRRITPTTRHYPELVKKTLMPSGITAFFQQGNTPRSHHVVGVLKGEVTIKLCYVLSSKEPAPEWRKGWDLNPRYGYPYA
jgi:hypothetical protein